MLQDIYLKRDFFVYIFSISIFAKCCSDFQCMLLFQFFIICLDFKRELVFVGVAEN